MVLIRFAAGIGKSGNLDKRHIFELNTPNVLEFVSSPVYRADLQVFHPALEHGTIVSVVGVLRHGNQGYKAVEAKRGLCRCRLREQRSTGDVDGSFADFAAIGVCRAKPIYSAGPSGFNQDGNQIRIQARQTTTRK